MMMESSALHGKEIARTEKKARITTVTILLNKIISPPYRRKLIQFTIKNRPALYIFSGSPAVS
jgi:hypothetical protein